MANKNARLHRLLEILPDFVYNFVQKYYNGESINTQIAYCIDIKTFLTFLLQQVEFKVKNDIDDFTPEDLQRVTLDLLLEYKIYLEKYELTYETTESATKTIIVTNDTKGIVRKLCTLRSLFGYLFKSDLIEKNITEKLDLPKIHHIIKKPLTFKEEIKVIDVFYHGEKYINDKKTLSNYEKRRQRDIALFVTLLGTGIRVSELVGLDIESLDFDNSSFVVKRKGGDMQEIYMPEQVEEELLKYLEIRKQQKNIKDKKALFLSNRGTRLAVNSVETVIKNNALLAGIENTEKMTVHALRRTFACKMLQEGVALDLVAELMGHEDPKTTKNFYAQHNKATHKNVMRRLKLGNDEILESKVE